MSTDKKENLKKDSKVTKKTDIKKNVDSKNPEVKKAVANKKAVDSSEDLKHVLSGKVVSIKMDKTIVVLMERKVKHPVYGKYIKNSSKFFVHDEDNKSKLGDVVQFKACRPYSKNKTWMLID